jgi:MFS transporter, DHA3 family, macrolide efflux protein
VAESFVGRFRGRGNEFTVLVGHWLSLIGSRFFGSSVAWFLTASIGVTGASWALAICQFAPTIVALPLAMAVVDAIGRRRMVNLADASRAAVCFAAAILCRWSGDTTIVLCLTILALRIFDTLYTPTVMGGIGAAARRQTLLSPQLVLQVVTSSAALLAPLLVPIATSTTVSVAMLINGVSYLLSWVAFRLAGDFLDGETPRQGGREALRNWRRSLVEGFAAFRRTPTLVTIIPTLPMIDLAYAGVVVVLPTVALTAAPQHAGGYYAALIFTYGAGRIAGAFVSRRFIHGSLDGAFLAANALVQGVLYLVFALTSTTPLSLLWLAAIGVMSGAASLSVNEIIQASVPGEVKSRVFALVTFCVVLFMPLGPVVSALASSIDVRLTIALLGCALLLVGIRPMASRQVRTFRLVIPDAEGTAVQPQ